MSIVDTLFQDLDMVDAIVMVCGFGMVLYNKSVRLIAYLPKQLFTLFNRWSKQLTKAYGSCLHICEEQRQIGLLP